MEIKNTNEAWSEYSLEDGNRIRMKQAVVSIIKTDQRNLDGTPLYVIQSQPIIQTIAQA
jgi:hypothetical protein